MLPYFIKHETLAIFDFNIVKTQGSDLVTNKQLSGFGNFISLLLFLLESSIAFEIYNENNSIYLINYFYFVVSKIQFQVTSNNN